MYCSSQFLKLLVWYSKSTFSVYYNRKKILLELTSESLGFTSIQIELLKSRANFIFKFISIVTHFGASTLGAWETGSLI